MQTQKSSLSKEPIWKQPSPHAYSLSGVVVVSVAPFPTETGYRASNEDGRIAVAKAESAVISVDVSQFYLQD